MLHDLPLEILSIVATHCVNDSDKRLNAIARRNLPLVSKELLKRFQTMRLPLGFVNSLAAVENGTWKAEGKRAWEVGKVKLAGVPPCNGHYTSHFKNISEVRDLSLIHI